MKTLRGQRGNGLSKTPFWTTVSPHDAFAAPLARPHMGSLLDEQLRWPDCDSIRANRLIRVNRFRVPELNPCFRTARVSGLRAQKIANCRFEVILANRSNVMIFLSANRFARITPIHIANRRAIHRVRKRAFFFQTCRFSSDSREFRESRDSRDPPERGKQRRIPQFSREFRDFRDSRDSSSEKTRFVMTPFSTQDSEWIASFHSQGHP